ncbi:hypothetical protein LCGC14_0789540 [marine sediment metagenome]|uniref:Uncharacterized protein n=1 Tax=marine sediment metagenome TaxID=412755 RepID=A0A0F9PT27_9ZZZZ
MEKRSTNIRFCISVNSRKVNLEEFNAKLRKLLVHFDIRKGDYTGKHNLSGLFINMVNETYKDVFGNNNPTDVVEKEWDVINVNNVREDIKNRFGHKLKKYGAKSVLYNDMKKYIIGILLEIEKRGLKTK